jgi:hypothetical protein
MPNATARANARSLPQATSRRAVLGAVLAAGAAGATAVLPAAASRAIAASEPCEDAALFALLAEARTVDVLQKEINGAEEAAYDRMIRPDRPIALSPWPDDHSLLRPRRAEFDEPDIRELRGLVESVEKLGPITMINQAVVRELKTRGREIIDAWDSYQADSDRSAEAVGLPGIDRRWKQTNERRRRVWSRITETPARTVEGMQAKIAFASSFNLLERGDLAGDTMEDILLSAAMDYAELYGQEART